MDEWWEVEDLTGLIDKLVRARLRERFKGNLKLTLLSRLTAWREFRGDARQKPCGSCRLSRAEDARRCRRT